MLPELRPDLKFPDRLIGTVPFAGRMIALSIEPDGSADEAVMGFASCAVAALEELDAKARQVAAIKLLPQYNMNWRNFSRVGPDGQEVEIKNPELGESDFMPRLTLTSLEIMGDSCLVLGYDDDRMFAGHSVFVTSFDGVQFAHANAQLFG